MPCSIAFVVSRVPFFCACTGNGECLLRCLQPPGLAWATSLLQQVAHGLVVCPHAPLLAACPDEGHSVTFEARDIAGDTDPAGWCQEWPWPGPHPFRTLAGGLAHTDRLTVARKDTWSRMQRARRWRCKWRRESGARGASGACREDETARPRPFQKAPLLSRGFAFTCSAASRARSQ